MFIDYELLSVPLIPPKITRQSKFRNLFELTYMKKYGKLDKQLPIDTEVDIDEYTFRSIEEPKLKKINSDSKEKQKFPTLKRINTY